MTTRATARLYSPELLGLATLLARYGMSDDLPLRAEVRSRSCGSVIAAGFALDDAGLIERIGMRVSACAIGQASAALLAQSAKGRAPDAVIAAGDALGAWLEGAGDLPDWPGIDALAPALPHPGRHGALLLPWKAAAQALCEAGEPR